MSQTFILEEGCEYRYYDMHQVVGSALQLVNQIKKNG
jgi:UDP-galactopyranose mutase